MNPPTFENAANAHLLTHNNYTSSLKKSLQQRTCHTETEIALSFCFTEAQQNSSIRHNNINNCPQQQNFVK